jgi:hypothetical protein
MLVTSGQAMAKASQEFRKPVFPSHFPSPDISETMKIKLGEVGI